MWYGCPERLSFSISYAYRILPMLMEEFQNILLSFRMRGNPPAHERFWGKVKYLFYQVKVVMHAFYPLMLNTAKRSRTTGGGVGNQRLPLCGGQQGGEKDEACYFEGHL